MRSILWMSLVLLGASGTASAQADFKTLPGDSWCHENSWDSSARACEVREATWAATGAPIAVDSAPNGGIEVVGWDRNEVRLRVKVVGGGTTQAEAQSAAAAVRIRTQGTIRAETDGSRHAWASFRLEVPRHSTLTLASKNGGVHLRNLTGSTEARTVNGGVHLEHMAGKVLARTTNGGVHVDLDGEAWDGESLDVATSNGGVHLEIPADYNAHLTTSTVNGRIHAPADLRRQFDGRRLDAELGRGGALIRIETRNGGLHVNQG